MLARCSSILAGENQLEPNPATMAHSIVQVTRCQPRTRHRCVTNHQMGKRKDFYRQHVFSSFTHLFTVQTLQRQSVTGHLERKAVINSQKTDAQKTSHQQNTSIVATALEKPQMRAPS